MSARADGSYVAEGVLPAARMAPARVPNAMGWRWHLAVLVLFTAFTAALFAHRWVLVDPSSVYSMPDVDTDGTLWFIWLKVHTGHIFSSIGIAHDLSYPFGYDLSPFPFDNLLDDIRAWIVQVSGGSWRDLIRVINVSALLAYPLSAYAMYLLCWHVTRRHAAAFAGAVVFAFSGYFLMLSRGSMSNNHFWLLPLVYLFFLKYLEGGALKYLLVSCVLNAIQFRINPYWAFYGWLFTPLILMMQPWPLRQIAARLALYCVLSGVFLFGLNIQFIQQQWFLVTNPVQSNLVRPAGGLESAIFPQGVPLVPGVASKLYPFSAPVDVGAFLGYPLVSVLIIACLFRDSWRHRYWAPFLLCFLLAVVLSSDFPALRFVNHAYFFFFDMFRGVSRIVQLASFFAGLLLAILCAGLRWGSSWHLPAVTAVFCAFYVWEVFPGSPTITQKTDFSQVASVYKSLEADEDARAVASYPMVYSNLNWGTAPLFEALGQVVHRKPIAGGKDLRLFSRDSEARPIFGNIGDPETVANLAANGINRIVIYNRIMEDAAAINEGLASDPRLQFLGTHRVPERECGNSLLCRSLDISVYAIKGVHARPAAGKG